MQQGINGILPTTVFKLIIVVVESLAFNILHSARYATACVCVYMSKDGAASRFELPRIVEESALNNNYKALFLVATTRL